MLGKPLGLTIKGDSLSSSTSSSRLHEMGIRYAAGAVGEYYSFIRDGSILVRKIPNPMFAPDL